MSGASGHPGREIGRLSFFRAWRISPVRGRTGHKAGLFFGRGLIRTVACMKNAHRTTGRRKPPKYEFRRKKHGSKQENDPHQAQGLRPPAYRQGSRDHRRDRQAHRAKVSGPIPLPTKKEVVTILRAVHKYKDSREQFERRTHKRLIDIMNPTQKTVEALMSLELPAGVEIEIKL